MTAQPSTTCPRSKGTCIGSPPLSRAALGGVQIYEQDVQRFILRERVRTRQNAWLRIMSLILRSRFSCLQVGVCPDPVRDNDLAYLAKGLAAHPALQKAAKGLFLLRTPPRLRRWPAFNNDILDPLDHRVQARVSRDCSLWLLGAATVAGRAMSLNLCRPTMHELQLHAAAHRLIEVLERA